MEQERSADTEEPLVECGCTFCWVQDSAAIKGTNSGRSRTFFSNISGILKK